MYGRDAAPTPSLRRAIKDLLGEAKSAAAGDCYATDHDEESVVELLSGRRREVLELLFGARLQRAQAGAEALCAAEWGPHEWDGMNEAGRSRYVALACVVLDAADGCEAPL